MKNKVLIFLLCPLVTILFCQCKSTGNENKKPENIEKKSLKLPTLPDAELNVLLEQCDFIDYIFLNLPFSLSQNEKSSIQQNILFISKEGLSEIPANCKPIARKFFKIKGSIILEADVYMDGNCSHFIFFKDNKAVYANKMEKSGINFYNNLIEQAAKMSQRDGQ